MASESTQPFLPRPERIRHANPDLPVALSEDIQGGKRVVMTMEELYGLNVKFAKLLENVTVVRVLQDANNQSTEYLLVDKNNIDNSLGWEEYISKEIFGKVVLSIKTSKLKIVY